jgi:TonB family protein
MSQTGTNFERQVADGKFPLLRCLGESDHSIVFLTERKLEPQKAAIKLISAKGSDAGAQMARWEAAAKLSHPHLIRLFEMGRCEINDRQYLYLVMEYADENLYQILPERPISAAEAREMLPPMLEALAYLHKEGFVHGHMKPANIMASGDQLKLSTDGVVRAGQTGDSGRDRNLYDPPEAAQSALSPAWDVWSLGVTLVEGLTQHPPLRKGTAEEQNLLPQSLPEPYSEIVRNCLRPRPEQRWSLDQIAASLILPTGSRASRSADSEQRLASPADRQTAANAQDQPTFANPGRLLVACLFTLMLLAFVVVKLWHGAREVNQSPVAASSPSTTPPSATSPSADKSANVHGQSSAVTAPKPARIAVSTKQSSSPPATTPSTETEAASSAGLVTQQVVPDVPRSASNTIHGTIRVKVKVAVDPSGAVSSASLISPGSSQYFARLALQASRKWKFASSGSVLKSWTLTFEFRRSGTRAAAVPSR